MKHALTYTASILGLAIGLVAGSALAQTTANGPYYATPSWDQKLACTTASNCLRFVVLSNWIDTDFPSGGAAVLDRETGLVWQRSPASYQTGQNGASIGCINQGTGGRGSWRLPSYQELTSLFEYAGQFGNLPAGHPFQNLQAGQYYWTYNLEGPSGFLVNISNGGNLRQNVFDPGNFWCVRSGAPGALNQ